MLDLQQTADGLNEQQTHSIYSDLSQISLQECVFVTLADEMMTEVILEHAYLAQRGNKQVGL